MTIVKPYPCSSSSTALDAFFPYHEMHVQMLWFLTGKIRFILMISINMNNINCIFGFYISYLFVFREGKEQTSIRGKILLSRSTTSPTATGLFSECSGSIPPTKSWCYINWGMLTLRVAEFFSCFLPLSDGDVVDVRGCLGRLPDLLKFYQGHWQLR